MTEQQMMETIEDIHPNIKKLAYVFLSKMKQPPNFKHNDLVQEGIQSAIQNIRSGRYDEDKGASLKTYLIRSVLTRFIDLMHASYKIPKSISSDLFIVVDEKSGSEDLKIPIEIEDILSPEEQKYAQFMILPPMEVRIKIVQNRKATRKLVREYLNMSREEEFEIRKSIKKKLAGVEE